MSPACRASIGAIPPVCWRWGRGLGRSGRGSGRRGAHSADHLGDKRQQWGVVGEVVCVVGTTAPGLVCRSHANPLLRALTRDIARKPAIPCLGEAAHARISGLACELAGPRARRGALAASAPRRTAPLKLSAHTRPRVRPHAGHVGYSYPHDETTAFNTNFPAPTSQKGTIQPTRFWPVTLASYHLETPRHDKEGARPASGPSDG